MFLGQIFSYKERGHDPISFFLQNRSKIKLGKSRISPEMMWKVPAFDMFFVITQPFLKISTSILYTYLSAIAI